MIPRLTICSVMMAACALLDTPSPLSRARAQDKRPQDPVLARIIRDWEARQAKCATAQYSTTALVHVPKGSRNEPDTPAGVQLPAEDVEYEITSILLLDFPTGRVRKETHNQVFSHRDERFHPFAQIEAFDGTSTKVYRPADKNEVTRQDPNVLRAEVIDHGDRGGASRLFSVGDRPICVAHGVIFPNRLGKGSLRQPIPAEEFALWRRLTGADGDIAIVRAPYRRGGLAVVQFTVDLSRQSAVSRVEFKQQDHVQSTIDIENRATEHGWLPASWTVTYYDADGKPTSFERVSVTKYAFDVAVSDADFRLDVEKPGMLVAKQGKLQQVGPDGDLVPVQGRYVLQKRHGWRWWQWIMVIAAPLVLLLLVAMRIRRGRRLESEGGR